MSVDICAYLWDGKKQVFSEDHARISLAQKKRVALSVFLVDGPSSPRRRQFWDETSGKPKPWFGYRWRLYGPHKFSGRTQKISLTHFSRDSLGSTLEAAWNGTLVHFPFELIRTSYLGSLLPPMMWDERWFCQNFCFFVLDHLFFFLSLQQESFADETF